MLDGFTDKEAVAEAASTSSRDPNTGGQGAFAAPSPSPGPEPSGSKAGEVEGGSAQGAGEDKESDAAAVTAVIWKELAELSAAQAKLKVCTPLALLLVRARVAYLGANGEHHWHCCLLGQELHLGGQARWGAGGGLIGIAVCRVRSSTTERRARGIYDAGDSMSF